jgi:hypothetical protein
MTISKKNSYNFGAFFSQKPFAGILLAHGPQN